MTTDAARPRSRPLDPSTVPSRRRELHGRRDPLRPDRGIDQVVVCPSGVYVVTVAAARPGPADWSGHRPSVPAAEAAGLVAPGVLAESREAADTVAALLPERYRGRVRPAVRLAGDVPVAEVVDGVLVTSPVTFEHILSAAPVVLSTSEVREVGLRLDARLERVPGTPAPRRRGWRRRSAAVAAVLAATVGAGLLLGLDVVPPPW